MRQESEGFGSAEINLMENYHEIQYEGHGKGHVSRTEG